MNFPYRALRVNGKVLVSFRRLKGFHAVLAFPGICCLTDQCIAESSVVQKKAENMFSFSLPQLLLVRTREKSRRLKQNKQEQGRMVFVYFGAEWAVRCSLLYYSCGSVWQRYPPFPAGPQAAAFPRNSPKLGWDWEWCSSAPQNPPLWAQLWHWCQIPCCHSSKPSCALSSFGSAVPWVPKVPGRASAAGTQEGAGTPW